ncbi:uncharacterized protein LAJ45_10053 [Morchella importuna]|uniref:uncharacterized protein n=1 Tax=Morchella importuna TaxID=1174673 RepID=UPI001E8E96E7|nr:uncharacterized protein LAJ45_10053 [Morchella importuna]KAH8145911.1 hypothetical protein LAJ45_10053 [Morchella importuna]
MDLKSDDNSYPPDCALRQYLNLFQEAVARTRKPLDVAEKLKDNLINETMKELGLRKGETTGIYAVEELKNGEIHVYNMHHFVIARRPL